MPKKLWLLLIGMVINVTGSSFLWPLNAIYIHDVLGKSMTMAGIVLMLNSAAGVVGNLLGGYLFDRVGGYRSIIIGLSTSVVSAIGLVWNNDWPYYVIFLFLIGFGSGMMFPSMYAMAGSVWPEGGRKPFNAMYVAQNIGVAVGAALGGVVANISFQLTFVANAAMFVVFLLLASFTYHRINVANVKPSGAGKVNGIQDKSRFTALLVLCLGYLMTWIAYVQWQANIGPHTQTLGVSLNQYSLLWTINGALIVLAQPLISTVVKYIAKTLKSQIILGSMIFIVSFIVVSNATQFSGFVVAMVILTIGEMLVWPAVPTIANDLAPKGREGFYQGVVNSAATGGRMLGPVIGGVMVDMYDINALYVLLIGVLFVSILTTFLYDRKIKTEESKAIAV
ncbi:MDR family MFS transporter [Bacillus suaedaesalsae]|uniref:MFS transporter n=1 Tax=Bacillus suaedaesalsae TaxID=2810349 RepID=A0ABS2DD48_9BACI|nr:MFS transporter [Bacillus suaedaesalsae]MBM6616374.1 MFS transporter [Bacillus suaedaesalsae]